MFVENESRVHVPTLYDFPWSTTVLLLPHKATNLKTHLFFDTPLNPGSYCPQY